LYYWVKEEDSSSHCNIEGSNPVKSGSENYYTVEALQPSYRDLDQIFDNSDTSSDETVSIIYGLLFLNARILLQKYIISMYMMIA